MHDIFHYEQETGKLFWQKGQRFAGKEAGSLHKGTGYIYIGLNGKRFLAHRLAWFLVHNEWPDFVDHDNGIRHDNRLLNLKNVLKKVNHRNMKRFTTNTSTVTGVHKHSQVDKWIASITVDGKNKHLGCFDDIEDAKKARQDAEKLYEFNPNHGRFA